jgi:tetratricopeptide (TPR) repeat protein
VGKRKHSEIKHADKVHEALTAFWAKLDPYVWPGAIVMGVLLALIGLWLLFGSRSSSGERAWADLFEIRDTYMPRGEEATVLEFDQNARTYVDKLAALTNDYRGRPVVAVALLDLAQACSGLGGGLRERNSVTPDLTPEEREQNDKAAHDLFVRAAQAAERFIADFPRHTLLALAYYEAGKARYELGEYAPAAEHFDQARARFATAFPKALAAYHAGRSYERTGHIEKARRAYEAVREERLAGWCGDLAEFRLAQLGTVATQSP